jgi:SseB protein N-terminal domain
MTALGGESRFRDDDGSADPVAAAALAALGAGTGTEHAALTALAGTRLLVPVVAAPGTGEHASEMSLPTLIGRDGRPAIPAFTCLSALARWQAEARPVATEPSLLWRAAVADSCAVVVDVAGPVPVAVDGARLAALADGRPVPLPHQDPDVQAAVRAAAAGRAAIAEVGIAPGDDGSDLALQVTLAPGCSRAAGDEAVRTLGGTLMTELGGRLRRGIAISAALAPAQPTS